MPVAYHPAHSSRLCVQVQAGEKMIMSLQAVNLSVAFSEISNPNYADGIGYSTTTGIVGEERIAIECSSGGREENIQHTYGDSLKLTKSLTTMLVLKAYKRSNASYKTFCKFKTIDIQCIKRTLTLFILFMDEEKKLVVEEKRSANMPICFDEIFDFMQVFELIAYLQVGRYFPFSLG
ncbi:hypothetical protein BDF21DRAFT_330146 [Thamnidium elegans]|nr:hypothetical protein BDF21DRAFT_330146 [Thamnidium elegans]